MIQVDGTTHTKGGVTVAKGMVLDVKPHFIDPVKIYDDKDVFIKTIYNIAFDVKPYKNLTTYKKKDSKVLVTDEFEEFNIGFLAEDVDIKALSSVDGLLDILRDHIENGDDSYSGVGSGNTSVVYP